MELKTYDDFVKGFNDTVAPDKLQDNELIEAINIDLSERGGFNTRKGTIKYNEVSFGGEVTQLIEWIIGPQKKILAVVDKKLYEVKADGSKILKLNVGVDKIGYVFIQHKLYFATGSDFYEYGICDLTSVDLEVDIKQGDIVHYTLEDSSKGKKGNFYKCKVDYGEQNLKDLDYTDTLRWDNVTDVKGFTSNVLRPVKPKEKLKTGEDIKDNKLDPIKKCKIFCLHPKSMRIFASGNPDNPNALYFSEPGEVGYFKGTNVLFPTNSEKEITTIVPFMNSVLVSYNNSWWKWSGIDPLVDATWQRLPIPYGCVSYDTVALTPYSITFLAKEGLYNISAGILSQEFLMVQSNQVIKNLADGKVENTLKQAQEHNNLNGLFYDEKYFLSFDNKILVYDFKTDGFVLYDNLKVNSFVKTSENDLLLGTTNYILKLGHGYSDIDVNTGGKIPINVKVRTKHYNMGLGINRKNVNFMYLILRQYKEFSSKVDLTLIADYDKTKFVDVDLTESLVYGRDWSKVWGWNDLIQKQFEIKKIAVRYQLLIECSQIDSPITIYGLSFAFKRLKPKAKHSTLHNEKGFLESNKLLM